MKPLRVLLADDHTLVRAGIRSLLDALGGIAVVAEAGEGQELLRLVEVHQPDIVITDITMPGLSGIEATARISREFPDVRVILLSVHTGESHVVQALRAGAAGYLAKDAAPVELELAIRAVVQGQTYLSPAVSGQLAGPYRQTEGGPARGQEPLTPRQGEILQLIAQGLSTKEIARQLQISVKTVETHRQQLMDRLDIHDVAGLVRYAIRTGLVTDE